MATRTRFLAWCLGSLIVACGGENNSGGKGDIDDDASVVADGSMMMGGDGDAPAPVPVCGNAILEEGEACDDGNTSGSDGCTDACVIELGFFCPTPGVACDRCSDSVRDADESCDDGNREPGDGCDVTCQVENGWDCSFNDCVAAECGDGIKAGTEQCDDGNRLSGDGCSFRCTRETNYVCVTPGEPCRLAVCGDSAIEGDETCDDGNPDGTDGCSATCQLEDHFKCEAPGSACVAIVCGDGAVEGTEQCDDANNAAPGCDGDCRLEDGYHCPTPGQACAGTTCGDGLVQGTEGCDDGNTNNDDGCSSACDAEPFYRCTGGPSSCKKITEYVAIAEYPAPMAQPQAITYDPTTRSFIVWGFDKDQDWQEVCLDGTLVSNEQRYRPREHLPDRCDGSDYDPYTNRFVFVNQTKKLTEVDVATGEVVRSADLTDDGMPGGLVIGDDGRMYVAIHNPKIIRVYERNATSSSVFIDAPTDGRSQDNLFSIPGEGMIGYYNVPPGETQHKFSFHTLDGTLVGRSSIPGVLFANGRPFPANADGGAAATDGGYFLVCSEYLDNDDLEDGICQLFSRRCETDSECANRIPGTACKLDAEIPYCYAPALARDDRYTVMLNSTNNSLHVTRNDTVSDAVCKGDTVEITAVTPGDREGTITIAEDKLNLVYTPKPGFCGQPEVFNYTVNLGGIVDEAKVTVLVVCVCGDGTQQANEQCDDGNTAPGDGCDPSCRLESACGNNRVDPGEQCDDGNLKPNDGCSPNCTNELVLL